MIEREIKGFAPEADIVFERILVNPDQIHEWDLPTAPAKTALAYIEGNTRYPVRDRVIFLLSVQAGLRAYEIAAITWAMCSGPQGDIGKALALTNGAAKGKTGGRAIPLTKSLRAALVALRAKRPDDKWIVHSDRGVRMTAGGIVHHFGKLYRNLGFEGCSSHSGRRTFISNLAVNAPKAGGSLREVQELAGHSSLQTTQRYIETNPQAKRKMIDSLC